MFLSLKSNCASTGHALHELGHVLGFWHEHMRSDRDKFIKIQWHNIICWACKNFAIAAANSTLVVPYDLASIMHYKLGAYGALGPAIQVLPTTPRPARCTKIGQRNALSALDILKTNLLYNCSRKPCTLHRSTRSLHAHACFCHSQYKLCIYCLDVATMCRRAGEAAKG